MLVVAIISLLGTGSYFGFDKYKIEDRKDRVVESCLDLANSAEETKHCSK